MSRHKIDLADADAALLSEELGAALGRRVAVSLRLPQVVDGQQLEGVVVVLDADTGVPLPDDAVPEAKVRSTLRKHKPGPRPADVRRERIQGAKDKAAKGDTAGALAEVLALLEQ